MDDPWIPYQSAEARVRVYGPTWALPQGQYTCLAYLRQLASAWREYGGALCEEGTWDRLSVEARFERRRIFCVSFMRGVRGRLTREKAREAHDDPGGHALMRDELRTLEQWLAQGGVRWQRRSGPPALWSEDGYQAGLSARVRLGVRGGTRGPRGDHRVGHAEAAHPLLQSGAQRIMWTELTVREAYGRVAEPWEVANVMVFLASDNASYMTGETVSVSSQQA